MGFHEETSFNVMPIITSIVGIAFVGILVFKFDVKGGRSVNRFFVGKAIGTIILFAILGIYLLIKLVLNLF